MVRATAATVARDFGSYSSLPKLRKAADSQMDTHPRRAGSGRTFRPGVGRRVAMFKIRNVATHCGKRDGGLSRVFAVP